MNEFLHALGRRLQAQSQRHGWDVDAALSITVSSESGESDDAPLQIKSKRPMAKCSGRGHGHVGLKRSHGPPSPTPEKPAPPSSPTPEKPAESLPQASEPFPPPHPEPLPPAPAVSMEPVMKSHDTDVEAGSFVDPGSEPKPLPVRLAKASKPKLSEKLAERSRASVWSCAWRTAIRQGKSKEEATACCDQAVKEWQAARRARDGTEAEKTIEKPKQQQRAKAKKSKAGRRRQRWRSRRRRQRRQRRWEKAVPKQGRRPKWAAWR